MAADDTLAIMTPDDGDILRDAINAVVKQWGDTTYQPDIAMEELVTMAILSKKKPLSIPEIIRWIIKRFRYYRNIAADAVLMVPNFNIPKPTEEQRERLHDFQNGITKTLRRFELPFEIARSESRFGISTSNGLRLIARHINQPDLKARAGVRSFFDLPIDIRTYIYELVFAYPKSGLRVRRIDTRSGALRLYMQVMSRDMNASFSFAQWAGNNRKTLRNALTTDLPTHAHSTILHPLLVNRQFHTEARPIFYKLNHFHCSNMEMLFNFLTCLPDSAREHITQTSVIVEGIDKTLIDSTSGLLAQARHIRKFYMHFPYTRGTDPFWLQGEMDVLAGFCSVKADQVFISGCPELEAWLKPHMLRQKPAAVVEMAERAERLNEGQEEASADIAKG